MPNFVVDPLLCTTPDTDDALGPWLQALDAWLGAAADSPFEWKHLHRCTVGLVELGRFPGFEALRRARSAAGVDTNTGDLLRRITRFFQDEARDLHAVTATQCVVIADGEASIEPAAIPERNLPDIRAPFTDSLLCLACDRAAGEPFARSTHLVTLPLAEPADEVAIRGAVGLVDPESIGKRLRSETLDERFPLLFSPEELSRFHHEALREGGEAVFPALLESIAKSTHPDTPLRSVRVGSHFWQSLQKTGLIEDAFATVKLLRICAALLADRLDSLNVDRRPKRSTMAANSPQQTRESDRAKAWRLTITKHGAGYRLHYWHVPAAGERAEQIELANVLRETDPVVIPDG